MTRIHTNQFGKKYMTYADFKRLVTEEGGASWHTLNSYDKIQRITTLADGLRCDDGITSRTLWAAQNWADRIDRES